MTYNEKKSLYESIMIDIAKMVKRQINEAVIKDGYVLDQYLDEKNDIKIRFGIKSTSKEDSMFFYSAFLDATSQSLNSLFIKVQGAGKTNKEWAKNVTKDTFDRLDDMIEKIYRACFKGTTNGYTLAKKMKSVAPKLGFEFIYKVVEDA